MEQTQKISSMKLEAPQIVWLLLFLFGTSASSQEVPSANNTRAELQVGDSQRNQSEPNEPGNLVESLNERLVKQSNLQAEESRQDEGVEIRIPPPRTSDRQTASLADPPIRQQSPGSYWSMSRDGSDRYQFGFDTEAVSRAQREAASNGDKPRLLREESRLADGTVIGRYGYTDPFNVFRTVQYVAGADGYFAAEDVGGVDSQNGLRGPNGTIQLNKQLHKALMQAREQRQLRSIAPKSQSDSPKSVEHDRTGEILDTHESSLRNAEIMDASDSSHSFGFSLRINHLRGSDGHSYATAFRPTQPSLTPSLYEPQKLNSENLILARENLRSKLPAPIYTPVMTSHYEAPLVSSQISPQSQAHWSSWSPPSVDQLQASSSWNLLNDNYSKQQVLLVDHQAKDTSLPTGHSSSIGHKLVSGIESNFDREASLLRNIQVNQLARSLNNAAFGVRASASEASHSWSSEKQVDPARSSANFHIRHQRQQSAYSNQPHLGLALKHFDAPLYRPEVHETKPNPQEIDQPTAVFSSTVIHSEVSPKRQKDQFERFTYKPSDYGAFGLRNTQGLTSDLSDMEADMSEQVAAYASNGTSRARIPDRSKKLLSIFKSRHAQANSTSASDSQTAKIRKPMPFGPSKEQESKRKTQDWSDSTTAIPASPHINPNSSQEIKLEKPRAMIVGPNGLEKIHEQTNVKHSTLDKALYDKILEIQREIIDRKLSSTTSTTQSPTTDRSPERDSTDLPITILNSKEVVVTTQLSKSPPTLNSTSEPSADPTERPDSKGIDTPSKHNPANNTLVQSVDAGFKPFTGSQSVNRQLPSDDRIIIDNKLDGNFSISQSQEGKFSTGTLMSIGESMDQGEFLSQLTRDMNSFDSVRSTAQPGLIETTQAPDFILNASLPSTTDNNTSVSSPESTITEAPLPSNISLLRSEPTPLAQSLDPSTTQSTVYTSPTSEIVTINLLNQTKSPELLLETTTIPSPSLNHSEKTMTPPPTPQVSTTDTTHIVSDFLTTMSNSTDSPSSSTNTTIAAISTNDTDASTRSPSADNIRRGQARIGRLVIKRGDRVVARYNASEPIPDSMIPIHGQANPNGTDLIFPDLPKLGMRIRNKTRRFGFESMRRAPRSVLNDSDSDEASAKVSLSNWSNRLSASSNSTSLHPRRMSVALKPPKVNKINYDPKEELKLLVEKIVDIERGASSNETIAVGLKSGQRHDRTTKNHSNSVISLVAPSNINDKERQRDQITINTDSKRVPDSNLAPFNVTNTTETKLVQQNSSQPVEISKSLSSSAKFTLPLTPELDRKWQNLKPVVADSIVARDSRVRFGEVRLDSMGHIHVRNNQSVTVHVDIKPQSTSLRGSTERTIDAPKSNETSRSSGPMKRDVSAAVPNSTGSRNQSRIESSTPIETESSVAKQRSQMVCIEV